MSLGAGSLLAGRVLGPVDAVARTAQNIAAQGDYSQRIPQAPGADELARLTRTVNDMLDRLGYTIERENSLPASPRNHAAGPLRANSGAAAHPR